MCYFLIKVLLVLSANFKTLVDANAESRVPERNTECLWDPGALFHSGYPFSLELSSLLVIADLSLGSLVQVWKSLAVTFSLSVAEMQH